MEYPTRAKIRVPWSESLSFRRAEMVPVGMPIRVASAVAVMASSIVCGKKIVIAWVTGIPPRTAEVVKPQSPWSSPAK